MSKFLHDKLANGSFCIMPWHQQIVDAQGELKLCCLNTEPLRDDKGERAAIDKGGLQTQWNSDVMREVRRKMVTGEKVGLCWACQEADRNGVRSFREQWTQDVIRFWASDYEKIVADSMANDYRVTPTPAALDLRFGNACNLKCRMCGPTNSNKIATEYAEIAEDDKEFADLVKFGGELASRLWHADPENIAQVEERIPNLRHLYMTGGEPTLIPQTIDFMKRCIAQGRAPEIHLSLNTNATLINRELLELIGQFRTARINVSLDGAGPTGEYIRTPSRWSTVAKNVERLVQLHKPQIIVTSALTILNVLEITDLWLWFEDLISQDPCQIQHGAEIIFVQWPNFMAIKQLPQAIKMEAYRRVQEYRKLSRYLEKPGWARLKHELEGLEHMLLSSAPPDAEEALREFVRFNVILDQRRGQSLQRSIPVLHRALVENGVAYPALDDSTDSSTKSSSCADPRSDSQV